MQVKYEQRPRLVPAPDRKSSHTWGRLVRTGYRMAIEGSSEGDWIEEIAREFHPLMARGLGLAAFSFRSGRNTLTFGSSVCVGFAQESFEALGRANKALTPSDIQAEVTGDPVFFYSERAGRSHRTYLSRAVIRVVSEHGMVDRLTVRVETPHGTSRWGVSFMAPLPFLGKRDRREQTMLERVAAHLAAAWRLRAALGGKTNSIDAKTESVFDSHGRLLHAEPEAQGRRERALLLDAVKRLRQSERGERARPEEAMELWQALVDGRWSLLAHTESDGKKLLLARRNEPRSQPWPDLSPRERHVAAYCALGHSTKLIAYELGVARSTVASLLSKAIRKLGLQSREDLVQILGAGAAASEEKARP
jgi:DNA-binding CsgD family transcriptional regulator